MKQSFTFQVSPCRVDCVEQQAAAPVHSPFFWSFIAGKLRQPPFFQFCSRDRSLFPIHEEKGNWNVLLLAGVIFLVFGEVKVVHQLIDTGSCSSPVADLTTGSCECISWNCTQIGTESHARFLVFVQSTSPHGSPISCVVSFPR